MLGRKLFSSALVLGLVVFMSFPAHADLLKNFKTDGSIETRAFGIDNETDVDPTNDDYRGEVNTRLMVGGSFDLLDDVHARVLIRKNNRNYGAAGGTSEDLNTIQDNLFVDNAYTKIDKVFGHVDLTMGRQFYGDPNDLLIYFGPQNDEFLSVTALDVFRADADLMGWAKFQGIAGKVADIGAAATNSDTDIWGFRLMNDKLLPKGGVAVSYYTERFKGAGATANNTVNSVDLCALGDLLDTGIGYHADYIQNFGHNSNVTPSPADDGKNQGNAYSIGVKYGHNVSAMPVRAQLEYGRGSADYVAIAAGKRYGLIWGEHSNFGPSTTVGGAGLTNLKVFDGGLGVNLNPKFGIDVNAYRFMYDRATPAGKTSAGSEYDLILSWKHSDNVYLEANAASFQVGDALDNVAGTATAPITRLGADVKIKF